MSEIVCGKALQGGHLDFEISLLVATCLSNKEVGRKLNVTDGTVKLHLNKIYGKLGLNNRTALAALAITCRDNFIVC